MPRAYIVRLLKCENCAIVFQAAAYIGLMTIVMTLTITMVILTMIITLTPRIRVSCCCCSVTK